MKVSLKVLGERLYEFRKELNLSQGEVAQTLGCQQNAVSRIENGRGGSIDFLLDMINFYKQYFIIDTLFSSSFQVMRQNEDASATIHHIIIERLRVLGEDVRTETEQLIKLLE